MNKHRPYKLATNPSEQEVREAFEFHISPEPNSGCWLWTGPTLMKRGQYGVFTMRRAGYIMARAHRVSWQLYCHSIAPAQHVLHKCDTPICVNPEHLFLGDQAANMADKAFKGRQLCGAQHPKFKHGRYVGDKQNPIYHASKT